MNFKKLIPVAVVAVVLIGWLFAANHVVVYFLVDSSNRLTSTSLEKYDGLSGSSPVYTKVTSETELGDFAEQFSISGGAFCETSVRNPARKIKLILKSDRKAFEADGTSAIRVDLYYQFCEKKNISGQGGDIGFQANFSTINLPNDIYELYIFVQENEDTYGIANTGKKYVKDSNGFHPYDGYGKAADISADTFEDGDIMFRVDTFYVNGDGRISTNGWGFLKDSRSSDTNVYMVLDTPRNRESIIIELGKEIRSDVSDVYGEQYLLCGFRAVLDPEYTLEDGIYVMRYLIEQNGVYYISSEAEQIIVSNDQTITRTHIEVE